MNKYKLKFTNEFKKSLKKVTKQGKDTKKLLDVVDKIIKKEKLDIKYKDHALYNDKRYHGCRECHIEPDWLLVYKYLDDELILVLVNTGSHSEVLNR